MAFDQFCRELNQHLLRIPSQNVLLFFAGKRIAKDAFKVTKFNPAQIASFFGRMGIGKLSLLEEHKAHNEYIFRLDNSAFKTNKKKASCYIASGLLAGYVEKITKRYTGAKEQKCVSKGDKYCEIHVRVLKD